MSFNKPRNCPSEVLVYKDLLLIYSYISLGVDTTSVEKSVPEMAYPLLNNSPRPHPAHHAGGDQPTTLPPETT
jgi:hypothetical protein